MRAENCGGGDARQCYSAHNGIDYDLDYELVRASAPGNVAYAGWRYPANHQAGEGLYVRIRHSNNYHTIYGHMSVLRVHTDDEGICETGEFSCILGISGNTGNSTGPHLHFELEPPNDDRSVNPYGWIDENHNDPWEDWSGLASHDVWLRYPSITNSNVYPSGAPLTAPPINENEPGAFSVDDGDANYSETAGCWTVD
ncbi:MAG: M23 family metallopeptidase, partial [Anaerolineae bacterium]|nr:M23 family metallopeptidase [Anaerolineae bacterium]